MRQLLKRFSDFETLPGTALEAAAARARRLRVPARRWLVRTGRTLSGRFYLLEGRVQLVEAGRTVIVNAGSARARRAVYPGASAVETLTQALFLNVQGPVPIAAEANDSRSGLALPEVRVAESSWQRRFLTSPLMQRLEPMAWQRILRAMSRRELRAGDAVIRLGEEADACYVLCSGGAEIRDAGESLVATLTAGNLFGEDALVSGRRRNANVVMQSDGAVVSLAAPLFQLWLLDVVVRPLSSPEGHRTLSLEQRAGADRYLPVTALRSAREALPAEEAYAIVGGSRTERWLAAFLLAEQGFDARPVEPSGLTPAPCGPGPTA